jgi:hypothetical protein
MFSPTSQHPTIRISKRMLALFAVLLIVGLALAFIPRTNSQSAIVEPAQRVAKGLATMDVYLRPDDYKSDLTWSAYQQIMALSPQYLAQNAKEPYSATLVKYGATVLLDDHVFGESVNAIVQTYVKNKSGVTILMEFQLQMVPDGKEWKVNNVTTLIKGEVPTAAVKSK